MSEVNKKAKPVKKLVDIKIVADPPNWIRNWNDLEQRAKELESWAREFNDFIRDHRSQDPVYLNIEREVITACSVCGGEWEPYEEDGLKYCAACGAEIETEILQENTRA